jgi:hypothetical protein
MDVADIIAVIERGEGVVSPQVIEALLSEVSQISWRALMWSQELHEKYGGAPLAPGARLPAKAVAPVRAEVFTEHVFREIKAPNF